MPYDSSPRVPYGYGVGVTSGKGRRFASQYLVLPPGSISMGLGDISSENVQGDFFHVGGPFGWRVFGGRKKGLGIGGIVSDSISAPGIALQLGSFEFFTTSPVPLITSIEPEVIEDGTSLAIFGQTFKDEQGSVYLVQSGTQINQTAITFWTNSQIVIECDLGDFLPGYEIKVRVVDSNGETSNLFPVSYFVAGGSLGSAITSRARLAPTINAIPYIEDPKRKKPKYNTE